MATNHSRWGRKWVYGLGSLLLVFVLLGIFALNNPVRFGQTYAGENKGKDIEQLPAEANKSLPTGEQKQKANQEKGLLRPDHTHHAFNQMLSQRERMVARQIKARGITDPNVLGAMRTVPRHAFVRRGDVRRAYSDQPLPIGLGQTISQPYIVGYMTEALNLSAKHKVLEVGTGSGYQAAICAEIVREVYTIEIIEKLAKAAAERLKKLGYRNVSVKAADGYYGWEEKGPFDAIIITAAATLVPPPLIEQLKPGGRMILPLGSPFRVQTLVLITKDGKGKIQSERLLPVRFVPMVGRIEAKQTREK